MNHISTKAGQRIKTNSKSGETEVIVIEPNGKGKGFPSMGLEIPEMERCAELPPNTLSKMVSHSDGIPVLKPPSGNTFKLSQCPGEDGKTREVIEFRDCRNLAQDLAQHPGKLDSATLDKLIKFLRWFSVREFYEHAYKAIAQIRTGKDCRVGLKWQQNRALGISPHKNWTDYIRDKDPKRAYGKWTNFIYQGLFGCNAATMKLWKTMAGDSKIARNHIPLAMELEAIAYCEKLVVMLDLDNLQETHIEAIRLTRKKFGFDQKDSAH